jgi:hypothetical protein
LAVPIDERDVHQAVVENTKQYDRAGRMGMAHHQNSKCPSIGTGFEVSWVFNFSRFFGTYSPFPLAAHFS